MNGREIAEAVAGVHRVTWVDRSLPEVPGEGWFLLEVNPLPPSGDILQVMSDICEDRQILVKDGQVKHYPGCSVAYHSLRPELRKVVQRLKTKSFKIAVHPGITGRYFGQPLAVAIDPVISYSVFPDHPHLNTGGIDQQAQFTGFLPDSLCYLEDIGELGTDPVGRFRNAFSFITIWLFRHMVWEAMRTSSGTAVWIGPEGPSLPDYGYFSVHSPSSECRCGSRKTYFECHMRTDVRKWPNYSHALEVILMRDIVSAQFRWEASYKAPQQRFVSRLTELVGLVNVSDQAALVQSETVKGNN